MGMFKTVQRLVVSALILGASVISVAETQDEVSLTWYQVEVFIFANEAFDASKGEQWPQELRLRYPSNSVRLTEVEEAVAVDNFSTIEDALNQPPVSEPENLEGRPAEESDSTATIEPPTAFELLPLEQFVLVDHAKKLSRQHNFRPLFHQAWLQTMDSRERSAPIVIRGGDQFDNHFELEGTIKLSVERYLHIQTDLWLSRFISMAASDEPFWNTLPLPPEVEKVEKTASDGLFIDATMPLSVRPSIDAFDFIAQPQYRVDKTVVMRQDRRMRSQELHYIDHPLFGMLLKVTPYEMNDELELEKGVEASTAL